MLFSRRRSGAELDGVDYLSQSRKGAKLGVVE